MDIGLLENVVMLLAAIIGLLITLFRYIETPKRGWLYITVFFLGHLLSDYYWTTYTLVMGENPDVSAVMAYFGWNVGYVCLLLTALHMRNPAAKRFFHPLMLLPIPINFYQFLIHIRYGGILNNIFEGTLVTAVACISLQALLFYWKNKDEGVHFPWTHAFLLLFVVTEYGMWTSSCYNWSSPATDPYYYFAFAECALLVVFSRAAEKDYEAEGFVYREKSAGEMRFQILLQIIITVVIFVGCLGGYSVAGLMKRSLPPDSASTNNYIALMLFAISIVLAVLVLVSITFTAIRFSKMEQSMPTTAVEQRGRFNFVFTVIITLCLMIASVVYTAQLFYRVSVTGLMEDGENKAAATAAGLENYLGVARSILWVTADTVELMLKNGVPQEEILTYIVEQTTNQKNQFDENFTGLYAYVNGEYMDGIGWVPPEGYEVEKRDWYKAAVAAGGETIFVPPYVDAQSGSVVITICKLLRDGKPEGSFEKREVVALDMVVSHIQTITEEVSIDGKGYGMVVSEDGLFIAHHDPEMNGKNMNDVFGKEVTDAVIRTRNGSVKVDLPDGEYTFFVQPVIAQWYIVIAISEAQLLKEVRAQLVVNILVSLIVFGLITFFYYLGYKNEQLFGKKVEEMRTAGMKREYEAQVLKLEKDTADRANRAKSRFLADMSHEIRTPINAILGMNEMVLRDTEDPDILSYARNIRVSGRTLLSLVNSILDLSKIEDGKMEIVPAAYNVSSMITYLVNSIQERAKEKKLDLILHIDPKLPSELYGDDSRINQVIVNLLTNAVKYTPEGSVTLTMRVSAKEDKRVRLYVEVKDTGIGIRESDRGKLFASFERLDLEKNRHIEGTGLGMSITTKLLALMDSELKVDSVYGEGSTFSFELWQGIEDDTPLGDYAVGTAEEDEDVRSFKLYAPDAHVLVVDDTRMNLLVATSLLKRTHIQVDTATSGAEALALTDQKVYDVILLDQRMPHMDGTQTLAKMRASENGKNITTPVICLTADAIRGAKERLVAEGFTDYLSKPVDGRTLENMLLMYLPKEKIAEMPSGKTGAAADALGAGAVERGSVVAGGDRAAGAGTVERGSVVADGTGAVGMDVSADAGAPTSSDGVPVQALLAAGVDVAQGLPYCMNDMEIYRQVITSYAQEAEERRVKLQEYYTAKDWPNYTTYVHSLKSSSKTIGAMELSGVAAGLEKAAKEGDGAYIAMDHDKAMAMYDKVVTAVYDNIDMSEGFVLPGDDGVIEF